MKIMAVANQKGGVGKSTTAINLSSFLAKNHQKRVLLIDLDPQGNSTEGLGVQVGKDQLTVADVICTDSVSVNDVVIKDVEKDNPNLHLLPADLNLSLAELKLSTTFGREFKLRNKLIDPQNQYQLDYDYIIIDCMPSFTTLTINAFTAATEILMPVKLGFFSMKGMDGFLQGLSVVNSQLCPMIKHKVEIKHVLFTFFNLNTKLHKEVYDALNELFKDKILDTRIPVNVKLDEAQAAGMPIHSYEQSCTGFEAYASLAKEVLERHKNEK
jgi:chromosome partitioning protein